MVKWSFLEWGVVVYSFKVNGVYVKRLEVVVSLSGCVNMWVC